MKVSDRTWCRWVVKDWLPHRREHRTGGRWDQRRPMSRDPVRRRWMDILLSQRSSLSLSSVIFPAAIWDEEYQISITFVERFKWTCEEKDESREDFCRTYLPIVDSHLQQNTIEFSVSSTSLIGSGMLKDQVNKEDKWRGKDLLEYWRGHIYGRMPIYFIHSIGIIRHLIIVTLSHLFWTMHLERVHSWRETKQVFQMNQLEGDATPRPWRCQIDVSNSRWAQFISSMICSLEMRWSTEWHGKREEAGRWDQQISFIEKESRRNVMRDGCVLGSDLNSSLSFQDVCNDDRQCEQVVDLRRTPKRRSRQTTCNSSVRWPSNIDSRWRQWRTERSIDSTRACRPDEACRQNQLRPATISSVEPRNECTSFLPDDP